MNEPLCFLYGFSLISKFLITGMLNSQTRVRCTKHTLPCGEPCESK